MLEGTVRFHCDGREVVAGRGSYVFLPRDVPHTFRVEGDEDAHLLTLISPGGGERFFVDAGRPPEGPGLPPPGPPDVEQHEADQRRVRRRDRRPAARPCAGLRPKTTLAARS